MQYDWRKTVLYRKSLSLTLRRVGGCVTIVTSYDSKRGNYQYVTPNEVITLEMNFLVITSLLPFF